MDRDGGLRPIIHKNLKRGMMWVAIETWGVSEGVPDSWYAAPGVCGWVEHKRVEKNGRLKIRPGQVGFLLRCSRMGTRCFVAARDRRSGDDLLLFAGADAPLLRDQGVAAAVPLGRWAGGPRRWGWEEMRGIITTT